MKLKKTIGILLAIVLVFAGLMSRPVKADGGSISFSPAEQTCRVGDTVTFTMAVSEPFSAAQITLYFSSKLEFQSCSGPETYTGSSGGSIFVMTDFVDNMQTATYTLTFVAAEAGDAELGVGSCDLSDVSGEGIQVSTTGPAKVHISEKETEPSTEPTEPSTDPTESSADPTDPVTPPTEPTEPSTDPTEPSTDPTEPSVDPTEPVTPPTEPPVQPTEPPTDPTEPVTEPPARLPSHDAAISTLVLRGGGSLSPAFNPETLRYRQEIPSDVSALSVEYSLREGHANAWFNRYLNSIPYGETDFYIHVTAEDGYTTREYHVTVVRPEPQSPGASQPAATLPVPVTTQPAATDPDDHTDPAGESTDPVEGSSEPAGEKEMILKKGSSLFKVLPIPREGGIPEGYVLREIKSAEGSFEALLPAGIKKASQYILYGVPMKLALPAGTGESTPVPQEDGEAAFYSYDLSQKSFQLLGSVVEPIPAESTEPSADESTEAPTEPSEEATTEAPAESTEGTAAPQVPTTIPTQPLTSPAPPETAAPDKGTLLSNAPWWTWLLAAGILGIGGFTMVKVLRGKDPEDEVPLPPKTDMQSRKTLREEERTAPHGEKKAETEKGEEFLDANHGALYHAAKESGSHWEVEDLDRVLDEKLGMDHPQENPHDKWLEGEGDIFGTEELFKEEGLKDSRPEDHL